MRGPRHIIFNGRSSEEFGIIVNSVDRPILPAVRVREMVIPGRDGTWDFGGETFDNRTITVNCTLIDSLDYLQNVRDIANWLSVKGNLIISDEPGIFWVGRLRDELPLTIDFRVSTFSIPFVVEPYAYGYDTGYDPEYLYNTGLLYDTGLLYPNKGTMQFLYNWQGLSLNSRTSRPVGVVFTTVGKVSNLKVTHVESGSYILVTYTQTTGTIVIDTQKELVTRNGVDILANVSLTGWFKLQNGSNRFIFEANIDPVATVTYSFMNKIL